MRSIIGKVTQAFLDKDEDVVQIKRTDALGIELAGERAHALKILDKIMRHLSVADAYEEMRKGDWRDPGPSVELSDITLQ
jgi:hypothetical protein